MEIERKELVSEVICDVFETLAFMFGELAEREDLPESPASGVGAKMTFDGDMAGEIAIAVPKRMCKEIAINILGMDMNEDLQLDATDSLKEVLNVICGQLLTSIAGDVPVFDLSVPEVSSLDGTEWANLRDDPETSAFLVDENPVLLRFSLEE